ncbi:hypothetical protein J3R82DRAFT_3169 [Butyriboletus roseoflavus]|nr:hypothetical protein J3R82DRAFT_3169 [Butyriboletus roseoflavus]
MAQLKVVYNNDKLLSGILYLHRITDNRVAGTPLKNLRVFRKLCGKDALEKVYLTTTMWDEVEPTVGERRLDDLSSDYWKAMVSQGAHITCCRSDADLPKELIRRILAKALARCCYKKRWSSWGRSSEKQLLGNNTRSY